MSVGETATLDASNSTDDEGIVAYRWDVDGDGAVENTTASATTTVSFENPGTYAPSVTVVDAAGNEATGNVSVAVESADTEPPTATLNVPGEVTVGETVTVEAVNVTDANNVTRVRWYSDGTGAGNGTSATISFAAPGEHTVALELRDSVGNERTITRTVTAVADESDQRETDGDDDTSGTDDGDSTDDDSDESRNGGNDDSDAESDESNDGSELDDPSDSSPSVPSNPGAPAGPSTPGTTPDDTDSGEESDAPAEPDSDTPSLSVTAVRVDNEIGRAHV